MAEDFDVKAFLQDFRDYYKDIEDNDVIQKSIALAVALSTAVAASAAKSKCQNVNQNGVSNNSNV